MTGELTDDPKLVVLAVGPSGCGKSYALWDLFVSKCPRRVSFDFMREVRRKWNTDAIEVSTYEDFLKALRFCAGGDRWHIALVYDPDEDTEFAARVARILNPPTTAHDDTPSFARAMGGVGIDCAECDFLFPNGRTSPRLRGMLQRGRHNKLMMFMGTHAPALVDTRLRDAADYFLTFRSQEDVVWKFWQRATSGAIADLISTLPLYHCGYIVKSEQRVYILDERRRVYRVLDYTGAEQ